jgi:DNA mismatch repair protein MutS
MFEHIGAAPTDELVMDAQTFRDLEIFEGAGGAKSLYDLIDQTRTAGGSKVLKERLKRPWASAARIRGVQESLGYILEHRSAFERLPSDIVAVEVESYLKAGLPLVVSENRLEIFTGALEVRFGDFRPYRLITRGVIRASKMVRSLRSLVSADGGASNPGRGEAGVLLDELRELVTRSSFDVVPEEERWDLPAWTVLALDRVFRYREQETLLRMLKLVYQLDALVAMADAIPDYELVLPEVVEGPLRVRGEGLFNLFVERPVPAELSLDQRLRMLFLTGPNMAGKTTYLRSCGIAIYLAHLGMGVPAGSFRFSPCECIVTSLTTTDDLRGGVSFFRAEAIRVKTIAQFVTTGKRVVALMDEPFKGTNVKDALDASWAVLEEFAHAQDSLFLISSHLIELGDDVHATGLVDCRHFEAAETEAGLSFDFVLKSGVSSQRLGMKVLEQEGIFDLFVHRQWRRRASAPSSSSRQA